MTLPPPVRSVQRLALRGGTLTRGARMIPEETPIALTYNRSAYAVMLASPSDLEDFAIGFSLTEGIVRDAAEIEDLAIVPQADGIELRMWLAPRTRRPGRHAPPPPRRSQRLRAVRHREPGRRGARPATRDLAGAVRRGVDRDAHWRRLPAAQTLNDQTHAVHAAAFWREPDHLVALREDVGRHNALDKLAGALARQGIAGGDGMLLLSSRISVELVQKAAMLGVPVIVAVSAPTALAVRLADAAGITLVGIARHDGCEIFTHSERIAQSERITLRAVQHVA